MKSDVLLVTTQLWPNAALLADALARAGLRVAGLCPAGHPMRAVKALGGVVTYRHLSRRSRLAQAVSRFAPTLIVPCDDLAVAVLHEIHAELHRDPGGQDLVTLIERSLGDPAFFEATRKKSAFLRLAVEEGCSVPETIILNSRAELEGWADRWPWPAVLKADGWWGGRGTRVVADAAEALAAYDELRRARTWFTALKDSARDSSVLPFYGRTLAQDAAITLQAFVPGRPLNRTVVCWQGRVLAAQTLEVIETMPNNGNATVVRPAEVAAATEIVERCVSRLELSGFAGFDFMYDEASGGCWLLEVNPRATSGCYTAPRGQEALVETFARLVRAVGAGAPEAFALGPTRLPGGGELIALFPQEIERDPASAYLRAADHQVPWHEPDLVRTCLELTGRASLYGRATGLVKAMRAGKSAPKSAAAPVPVPARERELASAAARR